jgi:fluoride ion exporter CrcB/FEX
MPIGTLISNILAVIIVAIVRRVILVNLDIAHLLQSIIDGFCGDLSTVSSWAAEMHTIKPIAHKWAYALLSFILS